MSVLSDKIGKALFAAMNVSGVTNLATRGVHSGVAPDGTNCPFVVFTAAIPSMVNYTFGPTNESEKSIWFITAYTDKDSSTTKEPGTLAEEILAACLTAIGNSLSLSGGSVTQGVWREDDLPHGKETLVDKTIFSRGFRLNVVAKL